MALDLPMRECSCGCGEIFLPKRCAQRFYSRECRYRYYNARKAPPEKTCPHCGRPI